MLVTTYTSFRRKLKSYLNTVRNNHTPLVITSGVGEDIVVISKSDYENMENVLNQFSKKDCQQHFLHQSQATHN